MFISRSKYKRIMGLIESNKKEIQDFKLEIGNNDVVNELNRLKGEVFMDKKEETSFYEPYMRIFYGDIFEKTYSPTLKTKVDAIIAYLGIKVETVGIPATPEKTKTTVTKNKTAVKKATKKVAKKTNRKK